MNQFVLVHIEQNTMVYLMILVFSWF